MTVASKGASAAASIPAAGVAVEQLASKEWKHSQHTTEFRRRRPCILVDATKEVARGENERVHHHGYSVAAHLEEEGGPSRPVSTGPRKERRRKVLVTRIGCRRLLHHQVGLVRAGR